MIVVGCGETEMIMKRKIVIVLVCLILIVSAAVAFGQSGYLISIDNKVEAGQKLNFRVDLEKIAAEEYGDYVMSANIDPSDPVVRLGVKENVNITENPATNTYTVSSADLKNIRALNFTLVPDEKIEEQTTFKVTVRITGQLKVTEEDFSFETIPRKVDPTTPTEPTKPTTFPTNPSEPTTAPTEKTQTPSIENGSDIEEEVDPKLVYKGSSDNYLKTLWVESYDFTKEFNKTKNTYFIDVKESVDSLRVYAEPCDKNARVDIVGNDNVSADMSKISINVKASNGDIRVYRIYVRKNQRKITNEEN